MHVFSEHKCEFQFKAHISCRLISSLFFSPPLFSPSPCLCVCKVIIFLSLPLAVCTPISTVYFSFVSVGNCSSLFIDVRRWEINFSTHQTSHCHHHHHHPLLVFKMCFSCFLLTYSVCFCCSSSKEVLVVSCHHNGMVWSRSVKLILTGAQSAIRLPLKGQL